MVVSTGGGEILLDGNQQPYTNSFIQQELIFLELQQV